jgi:hypothetical protein
MNLRPAQVRVYIDADLLGLGRFLAVASALPVLPAAIAGAGPVHPDP